MQALRITLILLVLPRIELEESHPGKTTQSVWRLLESSLSGVKSPEKVRKIAKISNNHSNLGLNIVEKYSKTRVDTGS